MPVEEGTAPPEVELPDDLGAWVQNHLDKNIASVMETEVLNVLTAAWLDHKGKWLAATKVLKKAGILGTVKPEVEKAGKQELTRRLAAKRRRGVDVSGPPPWEGLSFKVVKLVIYTSDPPSYEFQIQLSQDSDKVVPLLVSTEDLDKVAKFRRRFREILHEIPKGMHLKAEEWDDLQAYWLSQAERRAASEEGSEAGAIKGLIRDTLRSLPIGDDLDALKHSHVLRHPTKEGMWLAHGPGLKLAIKNLYGRAVPAHVWTMLLDKLGIKVDERVRVDGRQTRALMFHRRLDEADDPDPHFHRKKQSVVQEDLLN